jgi:predicted N-acyltransferase
MMRISQQNHHLKPDPEGDSMDILSSHTIRDIKEKEWDEFTGFFHPDRLHAWFRTVEDSGIRSMQYVFIKERRNLVAAACCFPYRQKTLGIQMPFLEIRSPLSTSRAFFSCDPQHSHALVTELEHIQTEENMKGVLLLNVTGTEVNHLRGHLSSFTPFPMYENTYINLPYSDFDDYLSSLSRKIRGNVRNTINKTKKRWKMKTLATTEFSKWKTVACTLQEYLCRIHNDYRWYLSERFYEALEKNCKEAAELLIIFKDDTPLVCGLTLNSSTICQCRAAGVDPRYREYQAYFLMYYEEIRRAIERNQKRIYFGTTTYTFKERMGFEKENLYGFVKMKNPITDLALKSYITLSSLWKKRF